MTEYTGTYKIERDIHFRPAIGIGNEVSWACSDFKGKAKITVGEWEYRGQISPSEIMLEVGKAHKFHKGNIEIKVSGDFPLEELKNAADKIGREFG